MIDTYIEKIIQSPLFQRLKNIVENSSYHDHEDVYSHVIKTKDIALREINGDFITNPDAKKSFLDFISEACNNSVVINEDFHGFKRSDIMILTALVHDIGKMLSVREAGQTKPLKVTNPAGITSFPGHEYWGSTIVGELLEDLSLPKQVVEYMTDIIRSHDTFSTPYFTGKTDWPMDVLINDVKSRAEGLYKEAMFNQYCDCFTAIPYQNAKEVVIKIFNEPTLYEGREYVIA